MATNMKQLTFGVEIECMLAFPRIKSQDDDTDIQIQGTTSYRDVEDQRDRYIREPLRQAGLQVSPDLFDYAQTFSTWFVKLDGSVHFFESEFASPARCSNGYEIENYQDMRYCNVEVVSPILPLTDKGLEQVAIAVRTLQKQRILIPKSAGLHVHVGNGTRGFSLPLLQNLAVLTSCFEEQWNQAHPYDRLFNSHCRLPRESFRAEDRDRRSMAGIFYGLTSIEDLIDKVHLPREKYGLSPRPDYYLERSRVVNYLNLKENIGGRIKRTVEFRQHAGTVDEFEILRWIATVGASVQAANDLPAEAFWAAIEAHCCESGEDDWTFSLLDVFDDFGVEWLKPLWAGRLHEHPTIYSSNNPGGTSLVRTHGVHNGEDRRMVPSDGGDGGWRD